MDKAGGGSSSHKVDKQAPNIPKEAFQRKPDFVMRKPSSK